MQENKRERLTSDTKRLVEKLIKKYGSLATVARLLDIKYYTFYHLLKRGSGTAKIISKINKGKNLL